MEIVDVSTWYLHTHTYLYAAAQSADKMYEMYKSNESIRTFQACLICFLNLKAKLTEASTNIKVLLIVCIKLVLVPKLELWHDKNGLYFDFEEAQRGRRSSKFFVSLFR